MPMSGVPWKNGGMKVILLLLKEQQQQHQIHPPAAGTVSEGNVGLQLTQGDTWGEAAPLPRGKRQIWGYFSADCSNAHTGRTSEGSQHCILQASLGLIWIWLMTERM